jgi:hypothetical protein
MSLASVGFYANITVADMEGNKSTLRYKLTSADAAAAVTDAATIITALNAITDGVIVGYSVGEQFDENAAWFAAQGVHVENVALISARIDDAQEKYAQLRIPAPAQGIFQALTGKKAKVVDPTDADLVAYLNLFVATTGVATLSDGENLLSPGTAGNVEGKRIHRANRNG